jgi:hypothetical protein
MATRRVCAVRTCNAAQPSGSAKDAWRSLARLRGPHIRDPWSAAERSKSGVSRGRSDQPPLSRCEIGAHGNDDGRGAAALHLAARDRLYTRTDGMDRLRAESQHLGDRGRVRLLTGCVFHCRRRLLLVTRVRDPVRLKAGGGEADRDAVREPVRGRSIQDRDRDRRVRSEGAPLMFAGGAARRRSRRGRRCAATA